MKSGMFLVATCVLYPVKSAITSVIRIGYGVHFPSKSHGQHVYHHSPAGGPHPASQVFKHAWSQVEALRSLPDRLHNSLEPSDANVCLMPISVILKSRDCQAAGIRKQQASMASPHLYSVGARFGIENVSHVVDISSGQPDVPYFFSLA